MAGASPADRQGGTHLAAPGQTIRVLRSPLKGRIPITTRLLTFDGITELRNATDRLVDLSAAYAEGDGPSQIPLALELAEAIEDFRDTAGIIFGKSGRRKFRYQPAWKADLDRASGLFNHLRRSGKPR